MRGTAEHDWRWDDREAFVCQACGLIRASDTPTWCSGPKPPAEIGETHTRAPHAPGEARRKVSLERLKAALAAVEKYADCGDNSCLFKSGQRRGAGTNGGCTCVGRGRPFVAAALAELVRAARAATAAEPTLPAEPVVDERRAPVQPVYKGGRVVKADGTVSWEEHELAWQEYARRYGNSQSAERIAERHSFDYNELTMFLGHEPQTWRPR